MGTRKAAVLPEPVGATPSTSRPCSMHGITCIWMGVGSLKAGTGSGQVQEGTKGQGAGGGVRSQSVRLWMV